MQIALIIYGSLDEVSGGFLYDRKLMEHLQQRGHEVTVLSIPWRSYGRSLVDNSSHRLLRRMQGQEFAVIVQDELIHPSVFQLNRRLRRVVQTPIVALIHLLRSSQRWPVWQRGLYRWVERRYLTTVDGCIYANRHIAARVRALLGTIPPGVVAPPAGNHLHVTLTPAQIVERAQRPGPLKIIFVGNLTPLKGLHRLLAVLQHVPATSWRLTVLGSQDRDRAYVRRMRQHIATMGWQEQVQFHGLRSQTEVAICLADSDVLAVPSYPESYSIAYLEALSQGLPVVTHAESDSADLIEHGVSGFHMQPDDLASAAQHLEALATDRAWLARMSLAARSRFAGLPTWEQSLSCAAQFLEDVAAQRSPAAWFERS
jgi:glycosyltransferase involved in cell wall biosynthesis